MQGKKDWVVHKFGTSCLRNSQDLVKIGEIVLCDDDVKTAVVVTALEGTTDKLLRSIEVARRQTKESVSTTFSRKEKHREEYKKIIEGIINEHSKLVIDLFGGDAISFISDLSEEKNELLALLYSVFISRQCSQTISGIICGIGELWCARILSEYLSRKYPELKVRFLNARDVIVAEETPLGKEVEWEMTQINMSKWRQENDDAELVVIPGFVASDTNGLATTLKRYSSDFSAAIFANLMKAKILTIWTDVDGIYSANPSTVANPVLLEELSYAEATELCFFGAKVIHPNAIQICMKNTIPMHLRNICNSTSQGTKIINGAKPSVLGARGFSTVDGITLLSIEGAGMVGSPMIPHLLFSCLKDIQANTLMITKGSSEHSICIGIRDEDVENVLEALRRQFYREIMNHDIEEITVTKDCTILAVVGDDMINCSGVIGRVTSAIGSAKISILAISQGSSERSISVVVKTKDAPNALKAVHDMFYVPLERLPCLHLALIGPGNVGTEVLKQIAYYNQKQNNIRDKLAVDVIARSKTMLLNPQPPFWIDLDTWHQDWEKKSIPANFEVLEGQMLKFKSWNNEVVIVDCTSSEVVIQYYHKWATLGMHIVAANKKFFSGCSVSDWQNFFSEIKKRRVSCHFEATVGAGLPLIAPLRNFIVKTGDTVIKIEGILSGTLAFIFNDLKKGERKFSEIVYKAKELGYTEPDPRDDLSAMDFARKLVGLVPLLPSQRSSRGERNFFSNVFLVYFFLRSTSSYKSLSSTPSTWVCNFFSPFVR
eukprot:TRINITY_DN10125_c0_g2_i3.p1 TRINITY_DN10125_c0_g2~~TRINITY_DN10125_c0_g2_i3.p1  ORF type:complete len:772 (-),score=163.05 TRINITY_DN10125_c0_g2_i3:525-2840(-)